MNWRETILTLPSAASVMPDAGEASTDAVRAARRRMAVVNGFCILPSCGGGRLLLLSQLFTLSLPKKISNEPEVRFNRHDIASLDPRMTDRKDRITKE